jgi:septal ring factor EnvC (AmiA/AmiB activator)
MRRVLLIALWLFSVGMAAQTKEELQKQKVQLQDQIELANSILKKTQNNKQASMNALQTLTQKIQTRERLIRTVDRQITRIDRDMARKEQEILDLEARVDSLKADYAALIQLAQRQKRPTQQILFILSSNSFAQAAKRIQYFKDMAAYRERQVHQIEETQVKLAQEREELARWQMPRNKSRSW